MAPCGKSKCDCGCKKKKAVKRKAPVKRRPLPQRGSNVIQTFPAVVQQQFMPSLETPIPSAVSKITGDNVVKKKTAEIGTQTEPIKVKKETVKKLKEILSKPMPVEKKPIEPAKREMSKSAIAAIARSQSARPTERVGNVVSFGPEPAEPKPVKVEDIKPRRGRPTIASKIAMSGTQPLISSVLPPRQN